MEILASNKSNLILDLNEINDFHAGIDAKIPIGVFND